MIRETVHALTACLVTFVLCSVAYPVAVWGIAWLAFPHQAGGSLIERDGKVIGSALVAQPFASDKYFQPRPSAVDYKADATGGSNLGTKNPDLRKKVAERAEALKATAEHPAPTDLVTASGGGLDPHISVEAARYQVARVSAARKLTADHVRDLIDQHTEWSGTIIGAPPRVNVLELNLALDDDHSTPASDSSKETSTHEHAPGPDHSAAVPTASTSTVKPEPEAPALTGEAAAIRSQIGELTQQIDGLRKRIGAIPPPPPSAGVKALDDRVSKLAEEVARTSSLVTQVDGLDTRIKNADETLRSIRTEMGALRDSLKTIAERDNAVAAVDLGPGLELLGKGRYAAAAEAFRTLAAGRPDDARAWYLAAVANGLATRTWTGETEVLVNKGVEREKAGTPKADEIDAALASLTKATGQEWLTYYRQRAK